MMPTYPTAQADATNRAWRTLVQGLLLDVLVAVVMAAATVVSDVEWTRVWWLALGGLLAKTAITAIVSYLARTLVPPRVPTGA
jgi:hypothetical protein